MSFLGSLLGETPFVFCELPPFSDVGISTLMVLLTAYTESECSLELVLELFRNPAPPPTPNTKTLQEQNWVLNLCGRQQLSKIISRNNSEN